MALTQIVVLAILQGIALVLPVGTASHVALLNALTGWEPPTPQFNLANHFGVLAATLIYFGGDLWEMATGVARAANGKRNAEARLAFQLIAASILAIGVGLALTIYVLDDQWRSLKITAWATLGFGFLLFVIDQTSMTVKRVEHSSIGDAIFVALSQVLSLVPGVSRVGITMTFARFLGYERIEAARFSYLLSIPALLALISGNAYRLFKAQELTFTRLDIVGAVIAFVVSLMTLASLMGFLKRRSFTPILIYRLIIGGIVALLAYDVIAF